MFKQLQVLSSVPFLLLLVGYGSDDVTTTPPIEQPPINSDLVLASILGITLNNKIREYYSSCLHLAKYNEVCL